jgi:hypothetical protein
MDVHVRLQMRRPQRWRPRVPSALAHNGPGEAVTGAVAGLAWLGAVFVWPQLPSGGTGGSDRQSSGLIAVATIMAALVVLTLTVGSIALQVLSQFSWGVTRIVVDKWLEGGLLVAAVGGVVMPLWVAIGPSPGRTRMGVVAAGWSALILMFTAVAAARRINPVALEHRTSIRALRLLTAQRPGRTGSRTRLVIAADALAELVAAPVLPYAQLRAAVLVYVAVLAARSRAGDAPDSVAAAVRDLAAVAQEETASSRSAAIVSVLGGLGIDQALVPAVHQAVQDGLLGIAQHARGAGSVGVSGLALDALGDVVDARVRLLLPVMRFPVPSRPRTAARARRGYFDGTPGFDVAGTSAGRAESGEGTTPLPEPPAAESNRPHQDAGPLLALINQAVDGGSPGAADVAAALSALGPQPGQGRQDTGIAAAIREQAADALITIAAEADRSQEEIRPQRSRPMLPEYEVDEMIEDTVTALRALLPASSPDSTAWPSGWQGMGAFDRDAQRIARLAERPYARGQHPATSIVEETLEEIAGLLRREPAHSMQAPADRTGWRDPTSAEDTGPIASTAMALAALMTLAFKAEFDRRALLTGRRILAAATSSAQAHDLPGLQAYARAMDKMTADAFRRGRTSRTQAGRHRQVTVLAGLLAESDQLLACGRHPELREAVEDITDYLVWRAPGSETTLAAACWQAQLLAAGWPVPSPGQLRLTEAKTGEVPVLPASLIEKAQETISRELGDEDPAWAAASIIALWVHAAGTIREDGGRETRRIAAFLTEQVRDHDARHAELPYREPPPDQDPAPGVRPLPSQLRRLISAAVTWCHNADPSAPLSIPPPQRARSIAVFARDLSRRRDFTNWTYRGVLTNDDETFVVVEDPDSSQRLLRDAEARARDTFTWGYPGSGPHTLAKALVADTLASDARCPACFGTAPCGAGVAQCRSCGDTGRRGGTEQAAETLVRTLISQIPQRCCWVLTRRHILTHLTEQATPADKENPTH